MPDPTSIASSAAPDAPASAPTAPAPTATPRLEWVDVAKGIAMLMVIVSHTYSGLSEPFNFEFLHGIHLVIFFCLTGYTLKRHELTRHYVNSKFTRLMVPYFITCAAVTVMDVVNSYLLKGTASLKTITSIVATDLARSFFASGTATSFGSLEFGTRIGAIWFLPAMFLALLIYQLLLGWTGDQKKLGLVTALCALLGSLSARFIWLPFSVQSAMMATFFIWVGHAVRTEGVLEKIGAPQFLLALGIFVWGVLCGYSYLGFVTAYAEDLVLSVVVGLAGTLVVCRLSMRLEGARPLAAIGRHALTVLCVHLFALNTLFTYFSNLLDAVGLVAGDARIWSCMGMHMVFATGGGSSSRPPRRAAALS